MTNSTLAARNPFRYRGYYYDVESGLYYLRSRYYDPIVEKFINSDSVAGYNNDLSAYNLFAYCGNNPVIRRDVGGMNWVITIATIVKNIHIINYCAVALGIDTAAIGAIFLQMKKDANGIYHASFDC